MEKARSLIETEEDLEQMTDGNGSGSRAGGGHAVSGHAYRRDASSSQTSEGLTSQAVPGSHTASAEPSEMAASEMEESEMEESGPSGSTRGVSGRSEIPENHPRELASGMHPRAVRPIESGVFSGVVGAVSGDRLVDSLQSALSAASRSEAGLGSLHRSVRDASRALTASRHAQEALTDELRVMYRGLNEVMSEKAAVERYAALLTQERDAALDAAEDARREARREREFLLREQDRFIQLLLEEHEAELQQLRRGLASQHSAPPAASAGEQAGPSTVRGVPTPMEQVPDERTGASAPGEVPGARAAASGVTEGVGPTAPRASGAALARLALVNSGSSDAHLAVTPQPAGSFQTWRSEFPFRDGERGGDERASSYPPPPTVLDLDSLAAEVDGNSERPPPIRRLGAEPTLQLKPARVPSDVENVPLPRSGDSDPERSES